MSDLQFGEYICSECGKKFALIQISLYKYKVGSKDKIKYQCSYTCYDHALLRLNKLGHMTISNYCKYVKGCEKTMIAQGKTILHPINLKDKLK